MLIHPEEEEMNDFGLLFLSFFFLKISTLLDFNVILLMLLFLDDIFLLSKLTEAKMRVFE